MSSSIPIVILAGGTNSRFFPLNYSDHKGLITLHGQMLLARLLQNLATHQFKDILFIHNPKTRPETLSVIKKIAETLEINVQFILQPQAKGMGDALLNAKSHLPETFAVCSPYHTTAGDIISRLQDLPTSVGLVAVHTDNPQDYGVLKIANNRAVGIVEKPTQQDAPSSLRVQSLYLLNSDLVDHLSNERDHQYSFETALDKYLADHSAAFITLESPLVSLKYPWRLFDIQKELFSGQSTLVDSSAAIAKSAVLDDSSGPIIVQSGASIGHATKLVGPTFIGSHAVIGDFTLIRQSSLEKGVKVGAHADIARSIMLPHSSFHGFGFIGDSIIGRAVKIGAGFITANKRFDRQDVQVVVKDAKKDVGYNHHGTIIGEHASVGIRVSTMPGCYIGANQTISPHQIIENHRPHIEK